MSAGLGLIRKVLTDKCSVAVLRENGVTSELFNSEERTAFDFMCDYYVKYGELPLLATVETETKVNIPLTPDNALGYWIEKVKENYIYRVTVDWINAGLKDKENLKRYGALEVNKLYHKISNVANTDRLLKLSDSAYKVLEAHDKKQRSGYMLGIPFGISYLDSITDGAQPGDFIVLCARPGMGKTMLLLKMANTAKNNGNKSLIVTLEMSAFQNTRRLLALDANVPNTRIRLGRLSPWGRKKIADKITEIESSDNLIYFLEGSLKTTVENIASIAQDLKPEIIYVDGAYMLQSANATNSRVERVSYTAEMLKTMATSLNIPVIATYQFNRQVNKTLSGGLGKIGWSDVISQLASIALGFVDYDEGERETFSIKQYKVLELLKGREGEQGSVKLLYDMLRMRIEQEEIIYGEKIEI